MTLEATLEVWLEGCPEPIGHLRRLATGDLQFAYAPGHLARGDGRAMSSRMPLGVATFDDPTTRTFFDNLLPEGDPRQAIAAQNRLPTSDVFGLLAILGREAPGAISIVPPGTAPMKSPGRFPQDYRRLEEPEMKEMVRSLAEGRAPKRNVHFSLAGVQAKMAIASFDSAFYEAGEGAPTTHILKVQRAAAREHGIVVNEFLCLEIFRRFGLPAVTATMQTIGGIECLLVERYDRRVEADGLVRRLHQEDATQALGIDRLLKYEKDHAGPEAPAVAGLQAILSLCEVCAVPAQSRDLVLRATMLNWLLGNSDAHLKNFSLLHRPEDLQAPPTSTSVGAAYLPNDIVAGLDLAPFYDIVCIAAYPEFTQDMAMSIGGERDWLMIGRPHWEAVIGLAARPQGHGRRIPAATRIRGLTALHGYASRLLPTICAIVDEGLLSWTRAKTVHDAVAARLRHINGIMGWSISAEADAVVTKGGGWGTES